jgi:hypothetical protein
MLASVFPQLIRTPPERAADNPCRRSCRDRTESLFRLGEAEKVHLVDGVEHLDDTPVGRSCPPAWRCRAAAAARPPWVCTPYATASPVTPAVQPGAQVPQVSLQVLPVGCPRHLIHSPARPGGGSPGRPLAGGPGRRGGQCREPCLLVPSCCLAHTVQPVWRALPGTASGRVLRPCFPW